MSKSIEIDCPACKEQALLLRKPVYEGLTRAGEQLLCSSCGHEFASEEEVPFRHRAKVQVFTEDDRSATPEVFEAGEARICRHCAHYVVNPFTQWCGRHLKEVDSTDTCSDFEERKEEEDEKSPI